MSACGGRGRVRQRDIRCQCPGGAAGGRAEPVPPRLLGLALRGMSTDAFVRWSFSHYLDIAHPAYAREYAGRDAPQALRAAA